MTAVLLTVPAAASADVLYDQTSGAPGGIVMSSHHATLGSTDADAADDFPVPPGLIWRLSSIDVQGSMPSATSATAVIFADAAGLPGAELFRQSGIAFPSGPAQSMSLSGVPPLPPGNYWLSVYTLWSSDPWGWQRQSPTYGYSAVWENALNGEGTGCTSFRALTQCGRSSASATDLVFRLDGTATPIAQRRKCTRRRHHHATVAKQKRCKRRRRSR